MKLLEEVKALNKKISLLKESILPSNWHSSWKEAEKLLPNFKILNEEEYYNIIKYSIKNQLEDYENNIEEPSETDENIKLKNWLFPNNEKAIKHFADVNKIRLFGSFIRDIKYFAKHWPKVPQVFDDQSLKSVCKVMRTTGGGFISGAATFFSNTDKKEHLIFYYWSFSVKMAYENEEELKNAIENEELEVSSDKPDLSNLFTVYPPYNARVTPYNLSFPITKKNFSLNDVPDKVFEYINKSVLNREYLLKLQEIAENLTQAKFEDTMKSQRVGRVLSKL
jgi:hypothetical protein